jgi:hypothetical protein
MEKSCQRMKKKTFCNSGYPLWLSMPLVLHNMLLENAAELLPACTIEAAFAVQTGDGAISHEQSVMGIVVRKKTLATERDQSLHLTDPIIQLVEIGLIPSLVDWIRLTQSSGHDLLYRRLNWNPGPIEGLADQATQILVSQAPLGIPGHAGKFSAQYR